MDICKKCGEKFESSSSGGNKKIYCSLKCQNAASTLREYYRRRNDKKYLERKSQEMKNWYQKNKERQSANVLRIYYNDKKKWRERTYTIRKRKDILKFISKSCQGCNKKQIKILHHIQYGNWPRLFMGAGHKEENLQLIKQYAEENILGFCSQQCHRRFERKQPCI